MSLEKLEARDAQADLALLSQRLVAEFGHMPGGEGADMTMDQVNAMLGRAWMMGARVVMNTTMGRQTCRICGCWELEACGETPWEACGWAEPGLCTACAEEG